MSSEQAQIHITGLAALITSSDSPPTIQVTVAQRSPNGHSTVFKTVFLLNAVVLSQTV
jgi:hypothetical protein